MNQDKPLGLGLLALGVAGIAHTMTFQVRLFGNDPGPQLFPILGFAMLVFCGVGMLLTAKAEGRKADLSFLSNPNVIRGAQMFGLMAAFSVGLWLVGFYIATPIATYAVYHLIAGPERRVFWRGALYAAILTAGVHGVFYGFLNTLLPSGILLN